jgi:hypothetical protein
LMDNCSVSHRLFCDLSPASGRCWTQGRSGRGRKSEVAESRTMMCALDHLCKRCQVSSLRSRTISLCAVGKKQNDSANTGPSGRTPVRRTAPPPPTIIFILVTRRYYSRRHSLCISRHIRNVR